MTHLYEPAAYARHVGSYWESTTRPPVWPKLDRDRKAHTVIIGGGYTGLNCALELAESGIAPDDIVILEARQPGWGASGRNGGFACMGGSKMDFDGHLSRFGEKETLKYFNIQQAAVESVRENLSRYAIGADEHSNGETQLAHRPREVENLKDEQVRLRERLGIESAFTERSELAKVGMSSPEFHGALTNPVGFAINPMKYVSGLAGQANRVGIASFGDTAAISLKQSNSRWSAETPTGTIEAENLVIATNGYTPETLANWFSGRFLPVLTNIIVTRPLSRAELESQGWTSHQMCYDTRTSLHYFHLLPKNENEDGPRMLFGMRGGTSASPASIARMKLRIRGDFDRMFPAWKGIETPFFWCGLACLNRDLTSFIGPVPGMANTFASLAYHGNGVAMGSHCGRLLAKLVTRNLSTDSLPEAMRTEPRTFPIPALRRTYLEIAYRWHEWRDNRP